MGLGEDQDRHGDFVRLLSAHSQQIFGFILALSPNRTDAEDIFQNASVALWKKFGVFQPGTNFRAWACQVAYLEVVEHRRRKSKLRQLLSDDALKVLAADAMKSEEVDRRENALADCLEKLPQVDRKLIERRYFDAQSPKQIADLHSKSIHAVYRSLARIHDALMRCMQRTLATERRS